MNEKPALLTGLAIALAAGYAALVAQADLLDAINVFPVADGDTGANLRASLAPLASAWPADREPPTVWRHDKEALAKTLVRTACGNSGNIAAAFFSELVWAETVDDLPELVAKGAVKATQAVAEPKAGTMLDVFVAVASLLRDKPVDAEHCPALLAALAEEICKGAALLPQLRAAGVADAGAVAMYIFFAGFFRHLTGDAGAETPLAAAFPGLLQVADSYQPVAEKGFCVNVLLDTGGASPASEIIATLGDSLVALPEQNHQWNHQWNHQPNGQANHQQNLWKLHVHSDDPAALRARLAAMGKIVSWSDSLLSSPPDSRLNSSLFGDHGLSTSSSILASVRVATDAAGSLPRSLAEREGITLFDSLIVIGGQAYPETEVNPAELYRRMRAGEKVNTAQTAWAEQERRLAECRAAGPFLYLAVGSAYTGNYAAALQYSRMKQKNNAAGASQAARAVVPLAVPLTVPLAVVDSGAASGRLALIAILTARRAARRGSVEDIEAYARLCGASCQEFLFIDTLVFLVAGGRVSKAGGFFGNLFGLKPIISPMPDGVRKLGLVRSRDGQVDFLKARLAERSIDRSIDRFADRLAGGLAEPLNERQSEEKGAAQPLVLLQYTDNQDWLTATLPPLIKLFYPQAEIRIVPLSLTTGAHVGPGSWSVALGYPPTEPPAESPTEPPAVSLVTGV